MTNSKWSQITISLDQLTNDRLGFVIQDEFEKIYNANSAPKKMAMFADNTVKNGDKFYFSPECYQHIKHLLSSYSGEACQVPELQNLSFIIGHSDSVAILFGKESAQEWEENLDRNNG